MLGGLGELIPRRPLARLLLVPILLGVLAGVGVTLALPHDHVPQLVRDRQGAEKQGSYAASGPIQPKFHFFTRVQGASAGGPVFGAPPPPRRHNRRVVTTADLAGGAIPGIALRAYEAGAAIADRMFRGCNITWSVLAGIGRVESGNGLTWGGAARVSRNGTLSPPIVGPLLNGKDGVPAYPTPDHGRLEGGGKWERAVGPMQFLPSTWNEYAPRATGSATANPQNYWQAAATAAVYLCANGGNMKTTRGFNTAILAYNHSEAYLALVRAWANFYGETGVKALGKNPAALVTGTVKYIPRPRAILAAAIERTASASRYLLAVTVRETTGGALYATADGAVSAGEGRWSNSLFLPRTGRFLLARRPGLRHELVSLPARIAKPLRERPGSWLSLSPPLARALGEPVDGAIRAATAVLGSANRLALGFSLRGSPVKQGRRGELFAGSLRLAGGGHRPQVAPSTAAIAGLVGAPSVRATVGLEGGDLRQLTLFLPRLSGVTDHPLTLEISFADLGGDVHVVSPGHISLFPVPTTTTTSTTTTTTTTSTTTTTTTTSTTTTSTTTTTVPLGTDR